MTQSSKALSLLMGLSRRVVMSLTLEPLIENRCEQTHKYRLSYSHGISMAYAFSLGAGIKKPGKARLLM
jgi:hypothetical protein